MGYGLYALFGAVGLALGAAQLRLVMVRGHQLRRHPAVEGGRFTGSVLGRLALISVRRVRVRPALPPGRASACSAAIAIYQFVAVVSSMVPLIKEIRQR